MVVVFAMIMLYLMCRMCGLASFVVNRELVIWEHLVERYFRSISLASMTGSTRIHVIKLAKVFNVLNTAGSSLINRHTNGNIYLANLTNL